MSQTQFSFIYSILTIKSGRDYVKLHKSITYLHVTARERDATAIDGGDD